MDVYTWDLRARLLLKKSRQITSADLLDAIENPRTRPARVKRAYSAIREYKHYKYSR